MTELRPYQIEAVNESRQHIGRGVKSVLINAPTGAGKTVIASSIVKSAVQKCKRVLFLAHRRELIEQCASKLVDAGVINHGIIMSGAALGNGLAPVQVASIQTLIRRELPLADLIIIDEAHRAAAGTYKTILANYPSAVVLGLTATPERLDGKGLSDLFAEMVVVDTVPGLIERGYLVKPLCYVGKPADLTGVRKSRGDYRESDLQAAVDKPDLIGDIVSNWQRLAAGLPTVAFAAGIEHANHIAQEFWRAGVPAAALSGEMSTTERQSIIADWRAGRIKVVANCMILTEGFDFPELACAILARPTQSVALYLQMAGRVMRPHASKDRALILDHAGCCEIHGQPHIERVWSLEGEQKKRRKAAAVHTCNACHLAFESEPKLFLAEIQERLTQQLANAARKLIGSGLAVCPGCSMARCNVCHGDFKPAVVRANVDDIAWVAEATCPHCHAQYSDNVAHLEGESERRAMPVAGDGTLELMDDNIPMGVQVRNDFKRLINEARARGFKRGYAFHRLKEKYDLETLQEYLPRHRGEWWRQAA